MTDCAFVSVATDVGLATSACTEWAVAVNATMDLGFGHNVRDWLVQSSETMTRVNLSCAKHTGRAEVPVWAVQTLVSYSSNVLEHLSAMQHSRKQDQELPCRSHHKWLDALHHGQLHKDWKYEM